jgi:hypothetical protein
MNTREQQTITTEDFYKDFKLYDRTSAKCNQGFYTKMLDKAVDDLEAILSNHNKLNVIRFDLYFTLPDNSEDYVQVQPEEANSYVSRFFKNLQDQMVSWSIPDKETGKTKNRKLKRSQIAYQSAMEFSTGKLLHFHCYVAYRGLASAYPNKETGVSGSTLTDESGSYIGIYRKIVETWKAVVPDGYGRAHFSIYKDRVTGEVHNNHFYSIGRTSKTFQADIEDCIYGLSYICKVFSKNSVQVENARRFNSSQRIKRGPCPMDLRAA